MFFSFFLSFWVSIGFFRRFRVMFWTDWGGKAKIESAGMDGTHRRTVVDDEDYVAWPNGLAVDLVLERLYWADAKHKHIMSVDYDGQRPKVVLNSWSTLKHPFSLTVFENRVYWTDWETEGVHYANKFDGSNATLLATGLYGPMTVRVHHEMSQPTFESTAEFSSASRPNAVRHWNFLFSVINKCANHPCTHLCAPTLHMFQGRTPYSPYTCLCADGYDIHRDGVTCISEWKIDRYETFFWQFYFRRWFFGQLYAITGADRTAENWPVCFGDDWNFSRFGVDWGRCKRKASAIFWLILIFLVFQLTYLLWKRFGGGGIKRLNFENPVYRRSPSRLDGVGDHYDHYDHLHLSIDSSADVGNDSNYHDFSQSSSASIGGSGVYQPTTTPYATGNYAIATSTAFETGKNSMKLPLTEHLYDEREYSWRIFLEVWPKL